MTTALAVPDTDDLSAIAAQLLRWTEAIRTANQGEARAAADNAATARKWFDTTRASAELRKAAVMLELAALRRLGQLNASPPRGYGPATAWLGGLTDAEYDVLVAQHVDERTTPIRLYRTVAARGVAEAKARERLRSLASGDRESPPESLEAPTESANETMQDLAEAASLILRLLGDGPVVVTDAAIRLARECGDDGDLTAAELEGYREAIRQALRSESDENWGSFAWVTTYTKEGGWLRIPAKAATLQQVRLMVMIRVKQAMSSVGAARTIALIYADLWNQAQECHDHDLPLGEWAQLKPAPPRRDYLTADWLTDPEASTSAVVDELRDLVACLADMLEAYDEVDGL